MAYPSNNRYINSSHIALTAVVWKLCTLSFVNRGRQCSYRYEFAF